MKLFALLAFFPLLIQAAPFIVSDPSTDIPPPDTCICTVGTSTVLPSAPTVNNACHVDASSIPVGPFSITCKFSSTDPIWGAQASAASLPFSAGRPGVPTAPKNLRQSAN
jgi:hypothetical protein